MKLVFKTDKATKQLFTNFPPHWCIWPNGLLRLALAEIKRHFNYMEARYILCSANGLELDSARASPDNRPELLKYHVDNRPVFFSLFTKIIFFTSLKDFLFIEHYLDFFVLLYDYIKLVIMDYKTSCESH